jgi:hypothetical protein
VIAPDRHSYKISASSEKLKPKPHAFLLPEPSPRGAADPLAREMQSEAPAGGPNQASAMNPRNSVDENDRRRGKFHAVETLPIQGQDWSVTEADAHDPGRGWPTRLGNGPGERPEPARIADEMAAAGPLRYLEGCRRTHLLPRLMEQLREVEGGLLHGSGNLQDLDQQEQHTALAEQLVAGRLDLGHAASCFGGEWPRRAVEEELDIAEDGVQWGAELVAESSRMRRCRPDPAARSRTHRHRFSRSTFFNLHGRMAIIERPPAAGQPFWPPPNGRPPRLLAP